VGFGVRLATGTEKPFRALRPRAATPPTATAADCSSATKLELTRKSGNAQRFRNRLMFDAYLLARGSMRARTSGGVHATRIVPRQSGAMSHQFACSAAVVGITPSLRRDEVKVAWIS